MSHYYSSNGSSWEVDPIAGNGTTYSAPAIAVLPTGEVAVVVEGPSGSLMRYTSTTPSPNGPSEWSPTIVAPSGTIAGPYYTDGPPGVAARPTGELDVVASGANNTLLYLSSDPPYT
ncbi:MAG: hypothetical protein JO211_14930, partial [Acidobacteriaceae bacterium]|nr:hypothetical protein [Acidobacteriaceae bacterium]